MLQIHVNDKEVQASFRKILQEAKRPRAILAAAAREVVNQLKKHFREKDKTPNKLGGERTHFWLEVARSVQAPVINETEAAVGISHVGIAQKYYGGLIRAKRVKALTIPVSAEAYGRAASTLAAEKNIKLVVLGKEPRGVLAEIAQDGTVKVHYALRTSVNQAEDPTALPPLSDLAQAALDRAGIALQRQLAT